MSRKRSDFTRYIVKLCKLWYNKSNYRTCSVYIVSQCTNTLQLEGESLCGLWLCCFSTSVGFLVHTSLSFVDCSSLTTLPLLRRISASTPKNILVVAHPLSREYRHHTSGGITLVASCTVSSPTGWLPSCFPWYWFTLWH